MGSLFPNDLFRVFITSQAEEDGLPKLVIERPLSKLDLSNQHRFDPIASSHEAAGVML